MKEKEFSISGLLKEGWELTKVNIGFLVVYQVILLAIAFLLNENEFSWKMIPFHLFGFIIIMLGKMGLYQSILMMTKGIKPKFDQFFRNWPQFLSWVAAHFIFAMLFVIGIALFVVPGLYVLARYGLFPFFILDKKLGPLEAIGEAGKATRGVRWHVFLLFMACIGLNILGLLFFFVGIFITAPITLFALATVYRLLTGQSKKSIQPSDIGAA